MSFIPCDLGRIVSLYHNFFPFLFIADISTPNHPLDPVNPCSRLRLRRPSSVALMLDSHNTCDHPACNSVACPSFSHLVDHSIPTAQHSSRASQPTRTARSCAISPLFARTRSFVLQNHNTCNMEVCSPFDSTSNCTMERIVRCSIAHEADRAEPPSSSAILSAEPQFVCHLFCMSRFVRLLFLTQEIVGNQTQLARDLMGNPQPNSIATTIRTTMGRAILPCRAEPPPWPLFSSTNNHQLSA